MYCPRPSVVLAALVGARDAGKQVEVVLHSRGRTTLFGTVGFGGPGGNGAIKRARRQEAKPPVGGPGAAGPGRIPRNK
jgi:hypothetical protein